MTAGRLTERVALYRDFPAEASDGQLVEIARLLGHEWAEVIPVGGNDRRIGRMLVADASHQVRIRRNSTTKALTPRDWIVRPTQAGGARLNIVAINDERNEHVFMLLECQERL